MNFQRQVRFAQRWGVVGTVLFGVLAAYPVVAGISYNGRELSEFLMRVSVVLLFGSVTLLFLGGLGRPLGRWMWVNVLRHSMNPYSGKTYDREGMRLWRLWVGDTKDFEDRP